MDTSEPQESSAPEVSTTADTQAPQEQQTEEQEQRQSDSSELQGSSDPQAPVKAETPSPQEQEADEQKQQQEQSQPEIEPTEISASKIEDSEETKITEETVKSTEDIKQEDALGQSVDIAEQPPTEDSHHELKVSDSGTLTETGRDEPRDEAQDRTSASEGQTGQESSTEKEDEKSKKDVVMKRSKPSKAERPPKTAERPTTQQSISSSRGESRQEKKKREKRMKRRSRHSTGEGAPPKLKKKSRGSRQSISESVKHLEVFLLSLYQPHDPQRSGYVDQTLFWQILESSLNLNYDELAGLQALFAPKKSGMIAYEEFAAQATDVIASLYQGQVASDKHWVELKAYDGSMVVSYNKQTGEIRDLVESGADLFEGVISEMFQLADQGQKGYISKEEFTNMLQSSEMLPYLQHEDIAQMQQYFASIPGGRATYTDFYPLAKEIILRVYRVKDPSESEWCQLNSPQVGVFWFNKYTGEASRIPADGREQEIDFLTRTYNQMEGLQAELEQCKQRNRDLENTLAQANEEQEALAAQLYETGHALDEANNEVLHKENELDQMRAIVSSKEQEVIRLKEQVAELEKVQEKLALSEEELLNARKTIEARDHSISERDTNISDLRKQTDVFTEKLKTANGVIDARESSIATLEQDLHSKQSQVKDFEKQVPQLEDKIASTEEELNSTKHVLEEKTSALAHSRKHLRNAREKNMDLERELEKLNLTQEKLHNAESEIRTLKSFLTTKTAIVEKRKKELRDTKAKVNELEEKDARRAVILADVLEKTARQYQQQLGTQPVGRSGRVSPGKGKTTRHEPDLRCASAPAIPPEGDQLEQERSPRTSRKTLLKSYTLDGPLMDDQLGASISKPSKPKARSRTVPKLPPIRQPRTMQRTRTFAVPTAHDIRRHYRDQDMAVVEHASSNPQCNCELCRMNLSIMGPSSLRPETGMTSKTGAGNQGETDVRELALARQLRIGQRVLVHIKKTEFDLEPQQLTGIVKFVGKIDSEYIDNRIYVGVKLDEAVGNTDGLVKGKRYFTCPPKHGKVVRITSIVSILPNKSVCYRPLQKISKRSPYTTVQKKVKIS